MSTQYSLVSRDQHAEKCWLRVSDYGFAAKANVATIAADELALASSAFPLAFIAHEERLTLVAVLGLATGQNHFVDAAGHWLAPYVPATFRGYPFRLTRADGAIALCVDETSGLIVARGRKPLPFAGKPVPFFEEDGSPHPETARMLQFLLAAEKGIERLKRPVEALQAEGVLEPWPIKLRDAAGEKHLAGVLRVNETALNALTPKRFVSLRDAGALPVAYAQLVSMHHLHNLRRLAGMSGDTKPDAPQGVFSLPEHGKIGFT
jgi:hypothetical protein